MKKEKNKSGIKRSRKVRKKEESLEKRKKEEQN